MKNKVKILLTLALTLIMCAAMAIMLTACSGTQGEKGDKGDPGTNGKDGISIVSVEKANSEGLVDTYRITYSDGKTTIFTVTNGRNGIDGSDGADGEDGTDGVNGKDGISITDVDINENGELVISFSEGNPVNLGKVVGADGVNGQDGTDGISIEGATVDENGNLILSFSDESKINAGKVKGENGVDGKDGVSVSGVEINESGELVLSFSDGKQNNLGKIIGKDGKDGIGIAEIELDGNYNLIIHYSNGETQNLGNIRGEKGEPGKDGVSIVSVEKTSSDGLTDTYTIAYSDGHTTTFTVTNGADGEAGQDGKDGRSITDVNIDEEGKLFIAFSDGSSTTFGETIVGTDGKDGVDGQDGIGIDSARVDENGDLILTLSNTTEINVGNVKGETGADGQNGVSISGVEINVLGELVISFSDGNQSNLGNIIGKDGTNGQDGQDGVGIGSIKLDDACYLTIYLTDGTEIPLGCIRGEKGEAGQDGTDGKDGQNGKSAYELYKEQFDYEGTEQEWLIDLANGNLAVVQTHTVTFDVISETPVPEPQIVKHGEKLTRPRDPQRIGHIFDGWYYQGEKWSFIGYVVTEDMTLTAHWIEENPPCEITYADGFTTDDSGEIPVLSKTVPNETANYDMIDEIFVSNGCTWKLYADYNGEKEYPLKSIPLEEGANEAYLVVFSADGLKQTRYLVKIYRQHILDYIFMDGETEIQKGTIEENSTIKTAPEIADEEGYAHYWSVNDQRVEFPYTVTGNTTFFVVREPIQYKISYSLDEGRFEQEPVSSFTIEDLPLTVNFSPAIKNDFAFMGWYAEEEFNGEQLSEFTIEEIGDITFYAKFIQGNSFSYIEENDGYTISRYLGSETAIIVPDYHADKPVLAIQSTNEKYPVFPDNVLSVTFGINSKLITVGNYAFKDCYSLPRIKIPSGVVSIGIKAFSGCSMLYNIEIPNSVTSIGNYAFNECIGLPRIKIPNGVASIGNYAFVGCKYLRSIEIPSSVISVGSSAFYLCNDLTSVYISDLESWCRIDFNGFNSTPMCYAHDLYLNGNLITNLVIPKGVTSIGDYAFYRCSGLTNVEIPSGVTSIGGDAFYGCSGLTSIEIPSGVTSIGGGAFSGCSGLTSIEIPSGVTSIGNSAFYGCSNLTSIEIPSGVTSIGNYAFSGCSGLTSIEIPNDVTSIGNYAFSGCSGLTSVEIPGSVTSIGSSAFYGCSGLTSVEIPSSVTSIGSSAFYGCSGLTNIKIPSDVVTMGEAAFFECTGLTEITFGENSQLTSLEKDTFNGCINLTSVIFGKNSQLTTIGKYAFNSCSNLINIDIPRGVISIGGYAFDKCNKQKNVYYGGASETEWGTISIGYYNTYIRNGSGAVHYYYLENEPPLTSDGSYEGNYWRYVDGIPIPWEWGKMKTFHFETNGGNEVKDIIAAALTELPNLTKEGFYFAGWYDNPEFTGNPITDLDLPYYNAEKTTLYVKWVINDGITSDGLEIVNGIVVGIGTCKDTVLHISLPIAEDAFRECTQITEVYLYDGCTSIKSYAFSQCINLERVYFKQTEMPKISSNAFVSLHWSTFYGVYVPQNLYDKYAAIGSYWQRYIVETNKLYPIE